VKHAVTASLAAILLAGCAGLDQKPYELSADQIMPHVRFVERETGYSLRPLPRVAVNGPEMRRVVSGSDSPFAYVPYGAFLVVNGQPTIYLDPARWGTLDSRIVSTVVHELVHHGQYLAYERARAEGREAALRQQKGWACGASTEREAYEVQRQWARSADPALYNSLLRTNVASLSACTRGTEVDIFADSRATIPTQRAAN
jgi:hypothetical protein